jgi:hypothetical protein
MLRARVTALFLAISLVGIVQPAPTLSASSTLSATDIVTKVGITPVYNVYTWGDASITDINHDGYNDVLLSRHNRDTWQLFQFNPTTQQYTDVWNVPIADHHACVWGDPNGDGRQDLYCVNGAGDGNVKGPNQLYVQQANGTFVDRAVAWGVTDPLGRGRDGIFLDANHDGWDDIFVANRPGRKDGKPSVNRLYINTGKGTFVDQTNQFGINAAVGGSCVTTADVNGDGYIDLFVCDGHDEWQAGTGGHLYINDHGQRFIDQTAASGLSGLKPVDAEFGDFDNDGQPDLAIAESGGARIRRNNGGVLNTNIMQKSSDAQVFDLASGDVDGDGRLDLYIVASGKQDKLWINDGASWPVLPTPQASAGIGESATMIPNWNGQGRAAIYVGNGSHTAPGPRQFIVVNSTLSNQRIEAEDYLSGGEGIAYHDTTAGNTGGAYRTDDVDVQPTKDSAGMYNVGWIAAGEWLRYDVDIPTSGSYHLSARVSSIYTGRTFHLEVDGAAVSGSITVPNTGSWQTWTTISVSSCSLSAGTHTLKFVAETDGFNVNYFDIGP